MRHDRFAPERRMTFFAVLIWSCFALLLIRLWILQIVFGADNLRLSMASTVHNITLPAPRGVFYDRHGKLLVNNIPSYNIVGLFETLRHQPETIEQLAGILGCPVDELNERLAATGSRPYDLYPLAKNVPVATAVRVAESMDLPGIEVLEVPSRRYIHGDFATHVFGYTREINQDEIATLRELGYQPGEAIGKTGLEKTYESFLRGENGVRRLEVDSNCRPVRQLVEIEPQPGDDLWLTLDYDVQMAAEKALRDQLIYLQQHTKLRKAKAGAVIAMDPRTGEVLAMVSQPSFDPNIFSNVLSPQTFAALRDDPGKPFNNRVLNGLYPPASTFKPFTVLAALENEVVVPEETFDCTGYDRIYGQKARCWIAAQGRGHGLLDLIGGLKNSCNVVMYELGRRLGIGRLARFARLFHFGQKTGIDLAPGDSDGIVPDRAYKERIKPGDPWRELETMHFSIGQGYLEVTPIQLAMAYAALANGGFFYQPKLVREIRDVDGVVIRSYERPREIGRVKIDDITRSLVIEGLNEVVSGGTAAGSFAGFPLAQYPVAGKTGTGEKKNYDDFALFACFAPIENPQIVVVVVVEQGGSGSATAAPVARKVLEAFFRIDPVAYRQPTSPPASAPASTPAPEVTDVSNEGADRDNVLPPNVDTALPPPGEIEPAVVPSTEPSAEEKDPPEQEVSAGD